jgi:cell division protein FtsL
MKQFSARGFIKKKRSPLFKVNIVVLIVLSGLLVWQAWQSNNQANFGQRLSDLQKQQDQLTHDVSQLQQQVTATSSLSYIQHYAVTNLGMKTVDDKSIRYLSYLEH